jgi:DNA-directed RNA polymerase subunit N (RpoN/RPB10)
MSAFNFKPILCSKCGTLIWSGVSWAGFARRLDKKRLTIEEEIIKRISGLRTYEAHRTMVSFEAVERTVNRIKWAGPDKTRVILADHHCSTMTLFETLDDAPNYWPKPTYANSTQGAPF